MTNLNDSGAGSLRQAVLDANASAGADDIVFQSGLLGTITLTSGQIGIAASGITVVDNGADLASVTIVLTSRPDGSRESLVAVGALPSGIVVSNPYDNLDGRLVLSGAAGAGAYAQAPSQIVYRNTSPGPSPCDRIVWVQMSQEIGGTASLMEGITDSSLNVAGSITRPICSGAINNCPTFHVGDATVFFEVTRGVAGTNMALDGDVTTCSIRALPGQDAVALGSTVTLGKI